MSRYHLAEINIGRLRAPVGDPLIADFVANLDRINALADASPGFVWRLTGEGDNATDVPDEVLCPKWNIYNSIFFAFTVVTTIGYGHLAPATEGGKLLCVFYSLLGIPINGILGNYFGSKVSDDESS